MIIMVYHHLPLWFHGCSKERIPPEDFLVSEKISSNSAGFRYSFDPEPQMCDGPPFLGVGHPTSLTVSKQCGHINRKPLQNWLYDRSLRWNSAPGTDQNPLENNQWQWASMYQLFCCSPGAGFWPITLFRVPRELKWPGSPQKLAIIHWKNGYVRRWGILYYSPF